MENKKKNIIITIIIITSMIMGGIILYVTEQNNDTDISNLEEMEEEFTTQHAENVSQNGEDVENDTGNTNKTENNVEDNVGNNETIIAIHITGEVKKPGLLYLKAGSRIADAIKKAGGATKNADLDRVNLAYVLSDGQKIYIPNKNEKEEKIAYIISDSGENILVEEGNSNHNPKGVEEKVNINTAEQTELETLPGIGPSLAQRIIEYRETNGNFQKIEDLQNVKGIGNSKYSNIKDNVCI